MADSASRPRQDPASGNWVAVIGTAGRDRTRPMDAHLWLAMLADLRGRLQPDDVLVSGGAAWSDHLAVAAFLHGWVQGLQLYLPAPFHSSPPRFECAAAGRCSGSAANHYHELFRQATGIDGLQEIAEAIARGAGVHCQPARAGFSGMFARNRLVAKSARRAVAYTWGEEGPCDGGTANTWRAMAGIARTHVSLLSLCERPVDREREPAPPRG